MDKVSDYRANRMLDQQMVRLKEMTAAHEQFAEKESAVFFLTEVVNQHELYSRGLKTAGLSRTHWVITFIGGLQMADSSSRDLLAVPPVRD